MEFWRHQRFLRNVRHESGNNPMGHQMCLNLSVFLNPLFSLQCLNSQQVEVYSVLESNTKNPEPRRNHPGEVRAGTLFLESSLMRWARGKRKPRATAALAGIKCVCYFPTSSPTERGKRDVASTRQLCCTCGVSSLFRHNPCCCCVTGSGRQMLCCVMFPGRYRDVWHCCSRSKGQTFVESWPDAVPHYSPFQIV